MDGAFLLDFGHPEFDWLTTACQVGMLCMSTVEVGRSHTMTDKAKRLSAIVAIGVLFIVGTFTPVGLVAYAIAAAIAGTLIRSSK
jgi:hypothetical protein